MKCIYYGTDSRVIDSRRIEDGGTYARHRCVACGRQFSAYERPVLPEAPVVKRDGARQPFERDKVRPGVPRAAKHVHLDTGQIKGIVPGIDYSVRDSCLNEISSKSIGEMVMKERLQLDTVAFVRYVSVCDGSEEPVQSVGLRRQISGADRGQQHV